MTAYPLPADECPLEGCRHPAHGPTSCQYGVSNEYGQDGPCGCRACDGCGGWGYVEFHGFDELCIVCHGDGVAA